MLTKHKEILDWLDLMDIRPFSIEYADKDSDSLIVNVQGNVDLKNKNLKEIPIQFGSVKGIFDCSYNKLESLQGCPYFVEDELDVSFNKLKSLKHVANTVGRSFDASDNNLLSLDFMPKIIGGAVDLMNNNISSLSGFNCDFEGRLYLNSKTIYDEDFVDFKNKNGTIILNKDIINKVLLKYEINEVLGKDEDNNCKETKFKI